MCPKRPTVFCRAEASTVPCCSRTTARRRPISNYLDRCPWSSECGPSTTSSSEAGRTVDVDNVAAAAIATQHLIDSGRTRIATITGPLGATAARDRLAGWRSTLEAAGLAGGSSSRAGSGLASASALELVEEGDYTPASGAAAAERLLARGVPFDGLFVASAQMRVGRPAVLREHGLSVPGDVAISTIDNNSFSTDTKPQLTTVDLHTSEKGAEMVKALLTLIAGEAVERETWIPIELVERSSSQE